MEKGKKYLENEKNEKVARFFCVSFLVKEKGGTIMRMYF